jgi:hypothetical protein
MGRLNNIDIKIFVEQNTAPNGSNTDGLLLQLKSVKSSSYQSMNRAVMATGAKMTGNGFKGVGTFKYRNHTVGHSQSL